MKRSQLPDEVFGIPQERKYPMPDKKHTRSAIKFFNHVEDKYEEQLAKAIIKNMKKYNIDYSVVGDDNRLKKYLPKDMILESNTEKLIYLDISKNKQKALGYLKKQGDKYDQYIDKYNGEIIIDSSTDHLVGTVLVGKTKDKGFITDLWVDKSYRGNGLGKRLLDDAVKKYSGIDLTVRKDNEVAVSMYKKYGFVPIDYSNKEYYWMKLRSKLDKNDKLLSEGVGLQAYQYNTNILPDHDSTKDSISEYGTTAGTIVEPNQADSVYIVNYMQNNVFSGKKEQRLAICKKGMKDLHAFGGKYNKFHYISDLNEFENEASDIKVFKYIGKPKNSFYEIIEDTVTDTDVYRLLTGRDLPDRDFIAFDPEFVEEECFIYELAAIQECVEAGVKLDNNIVPLRVLTETVEGRPYNYYRDIDGIFVQHELTGIRSNSYDNKDDIPKAVLDIVKRGYII